MSIPKDWIKVSEYDKKSGFHGEAFYKDGKVVIAMRGTEITKAMNIDFKDIDTNRVFTNEEIGQMPQDEYSRLENFINQQVVEGKVMPESQAKQQVQAGNLIYVNPYTRSDGTEVKGYYRSR